MRIAQIAPLAESVPPKLYGGTERVVSWLTEELVGLGHDVTLFASGDSRTSAKLVPVCPRALRLSRPRPDPAAACAVLLEAVAERAADFDVIHCHMDWVHLPLLRRLRTPFLTTLHGRLDLPDLPLTAQHFSDAPFVSISQRQRAPLPGLNWLATIHHGLPPDLLKLSERAEGYLAFLGRIAPEKGPDVAIRVAHAAKLPLRIAAKVPRAENRYFNETIKPLLDQNNVEFVGEVNDRQKQTFLGNAAALLFPIDWPEPFGLVMIEAMACGTPVIAWSRGSVPEVIEGGVTGFIVESEAEAVAAIGHIRGLDRRHIRERFDQRFTARRMAEEYVASYRLLAQAPTEVRRTRARKRSVSMAPLAAVSHEISKNSMNKIGIRSNSLRSFRTENRRASTAKGGERSKPP
jgi:glycosyltransferase involved in cell wall biosynthesis